MNPTMFSALADPNRFHIVELLRDKPRPVGEIADRLHIRQPQVSKHLKILADAEIVEMHPVAQKRIYGLRSQPFKELNNWIESYRHVWDERFDRLNKILKREKKARLR